MKYILSLVPLLAVATAQNTCPNGSSSVTINNFSVCCPGSVSDCPGGSGTCCLVGCKITSSGPFYSSCYPLCQNPADNQPTPISFSTSGTCTGVPITASDYSSRVYGSGGQPTDTANTGTTTVSGTTSTMTTTSTMSVSHGSGAMVTAAPAMILGAVAGFMML